MDEPIVLLIFIVKYVPKYLPHSVLGLSQLPRLDSFLSALAGFDSCSSEINLFANPFSLNLKNSITDINLLN